MSDLRIILGTVFGLSNMLIGPIPCHIMVKGILVASRWKYLPGTEYSFLQFETVVKAIK